MFFLKVLRKAWSIWPCKRLSRLILQLIFMYNLKALRIWECPNINLTLKLLCLPPKKPPSQPIPSHPCRLVSWPSGLQCCFGSLWEGLASRPSHFEDNAKAHSARTFVIVKYPAVQCRGSCESVTITVDVLKGSKTVWLDARSIALYLRLTTYKYAFLIWYVWNHTKYDLHLSRHSSLHDGLQSVGHECTRTYKNTVWMI